MESETGAHKLVGRAQKGEKMGPCTFKYSPQNMEEATARQSVSPGSISIWWWLKSLIRILTTTYWVLTMSQILTYFVLFILSTLKGSYSYSPFYSWENSLKEFQKLPQGHPSKGSRKIEFQMQVSLMLNPKLLAPLWFRNAWEDFKKFQKPKPIPKDLHHLVWTGPRALISFQSSRGTYS